MASSVIVLTRDARVARQCSSVLSNCRSLLVDPKDADEPPAKLIANVLQDGLKKGWCQRGDPVIALYASPGLRSGATNKMKLLFVE